MLHADVIYVDGNGFLVMVYEPLNLTLQVHIKQESQSVLGSALQRRLELLLSRGLMPLMVHVDPQSAFHILNLKVW